MSTENQNIDVQNNSDGQRYEVHLDGETAVLTYEREPGVIVFLHTGVPHALEGHGIANLLARTALDNARAQHLTVVPECPFVAAYIRRHQEYLPLVAEEYRAELGPR